MVYQVVFSPEALQDLLDQKDYLAMKVSPDFAAKHIDAVISYCESLKSMPHRGTMRDDIRLGLRIVPYKEATVAISVDIVQVSILGVFFGGRNYETVLRPGSED
jgi:toxin ParE1/3/4